MRRQRWIDPFLWMFSLGDLVAIAWWVVSTPAHLMFHSCRDKSRLETDDNG
jgi:hypothetical protein